MRHRHRVLAGAVCCLLAACASDSTIEAAANAEVPVCDDLRARENDLIETMNRALVALGDATTDAGRADALARGYDVLVDEVRRQRDRRPAGIAGDEALEAALQDGLDAALVEAQQARDAFTETEVALSDERGEAGTLQTTVEKVFSLYEPARSAYQDAGLADAIDRDPDCRFVTQRADPAAGP